MESENRFLSREKLLGIRHHRHFAWWVLILATVLFLDLAVLNYKILSDEKTGSRVEVQTGSEEKSVSPQGSSVSTSEDTCGQSCLNEINKAVSSALSNQESSSQQPVSTGASGQSIKEFFIPLGAGTISSTSWQTIPGLQAYIDGSAYGNIQSATFEISVSVPTGNQTANFQLYNSTLSHPVWSSNVTFTGGGTPQLLISSPISLDPGSNLYVVQGQTQLQFPANVTQARVHIITQ